MILPKHPTIQWQMQDEIDVRRNAYRGAQILRLNLFLLSGAIRSQPVQYFSFFGPCTVLQCIFLWEFLSTGHDLSDVVC